MPQPLSNETPQPSSSTNQNPSVYDVRSRDKFKFLADLSSDLDSDEGYAYPTPIQLPNRIAKAYESDFDVEEEHFYKPFGNQLPKFVEHSSFVPSYPKTNEKGYATVVELPREANLTKEKMRSLRQAMQYTLTGGRGEELIEHVQFFETEGDEDMNISMYKTYRRCAGVKVLNTTEDSGTNDFRFASFYQRIYVDLTQRLMLKMVIFGRNIWLSRKNKLLPMQIVLSFKLRLCMRDIKTTNALGSMSKVINAKEKQLFVPFLLNVAKALLSIYLLAASIIKVVKKAICFFQSEMSTFQLFFEILALVEPMFTKIFLMQSIFLRRTRRIMVHSSF